MFSALWKEQPRPRVPTGGLPTVHAGGLPTVHGGAEADRHSPGPPVEPRIASAAYVLSRVCSRSATRPTAAASAFRWVRVFFPDRVRVANLVIVLAVVADFTASASLRKTPRSVVRLGLGAVASSSSFCPPRVWRSSHLSLCRTTRHSQPRRCSYIDLDRLFTNLRRQYDTDAEPRAGAVGLPHLRPLKKPAAVRVRSHR